MNSLVGTEEYIAPEIITDSSLSYASDYWSLGIILYQLFCGKTPFKGANESETFRNIQSNKDVEFKEHLQVPETARNLISMLLVKDPEKRLGKDGIEYIMQHEYFENVSWQTVLSEKVPFSPPVRPKRPIARPGSKYASFALPT